MYWCMLLYIRLNISHQIRGTVHYTIYILYFFTYNIVNKNVSCYTGLSKNVIQNNGKYTFIRSTSLTKATMFSKEGSRSHKWINCIHPGALLNLMWCSSKALRTIL